MVTAGRIRKNSMRSHMFRSFDGACATTPSQIRATSAPDGNILRCPVIKLYSGGDKSRLVAFLRGRRLLIRLMEPRDYKQAQ